MNQQSTSASEAMASAYAIAKQTGKRVYRHTTTNAKGQHRWLITFRKYPTNATTYSTLKVAA
jgi:hypothetical protein